MKTEKGRAIVLILFVWGLAGGLFGSLFAGLHQVLQVVGLEGWQPLVVGAAAAAMTTSAFYSSMPVALVGAAAGILASIAYLMVMGHQVQLPIITGVAAVAGVLAGVFYAWLGKGGTRPLAQTVAGLLAGLAAGALLALGLAVADTEIDMFPLVAGVVALVGGLFQLSRGWLVSTSSSWCPQLLSAPIVAGLIAAVVGASVWIMGGTTAMALDAATKGAIDEVVNRMPAGFFGGMLGGAVTGVLLELMGMRLGEYDETYD
jgi:hypothetical protein